ncbi:MAG: GntR family transcriptional regulator [Anaerolineaceae bacterium]|nr:GntR family transcriptional regulator [Anaerolineaceae bacterium]
METKKTPQRLSDTTYDKICTSLYSGDIRPGDWLRQASLAEDLDVSQATVRDALNKMVMEGMAERVPRKGVRIPILSIEDLSDIYEIRIVAEGLAWQTAAEKITEKEILKMRELLPLTGVNADPKSVQITHHNNQEFHMIAIQASRRWTLIHVLSSLLNRNNLFYLLAASTEETRVEDGQQNISDHIDLLDALEKRKPEMARKLIVNHIRKAMSDRMALKTREDWIH